MDAKINFATGISKMSSRSKSRADRWKRYRNREPIKISFERRFSSEAKYTIKMVIRNQNRLNQDNTSYDIILVTGIATIALPDLNDAILFA